MRVPISLFALPWFLLLSLLLLSLLLPVAVGYAQTVVFEEDFTEAPPDGWTLESGWTIGATTPSSGSGGNNLEHSAARIANAATPDFSLTGAGFALLTYSVRRTGAYDRGNLRIAASIDGGVTFPIVVLGAGAAAPEATSAYRDITVALPPALLNRPIVTLRFEGLGASKSGNLRIDDVRVTSYATAGTVRGALQFGEQRGSLVSGGDSIRVPVALNVTALAGVTGVQFEVGWRGGHLRLHNVLRGESVSDDGAWTLQYAASEGALKVLLLGQGIAALPSGRYDPLVTLQFRADLVRTARNDTLVLSNAVGAQAVSDGADAGLGIGTSEYVLTVRPPQPEFSVSSSIFDVGDVDVGEADSVRVQVKNAADQANLHLTNIAAEHPLFTVHPNSGMVAPGDSLDVHVMFEPSPTIFGPQETRVYFQHNGDPSPEIVYVTGRGRGGRGDAEGDGAVDVMDIVHAIDFVLARRVATPAQTTAVDLFPFPAGDDTLDVRDLTVLSQGIMRGQWPDGVALPPETPSAEKAGSALAHVQRIDQGGARHLLRLEYDAPMRGFQIIAPVSKAGVSVMAPPDSRVMLGSGYDAERGEIRIVGYVADGEALPPGAMDIVLSGPVDSPRYATLIDRDRNRIAVQERPPAVLPPPEVPGSNTDPHPPYPNPFYVCNDILRIPSLSPDTEAEVFDMLGRRVFRMRVEESTFEWDGCTASGPGIAPGLYVIRLKSEEKVQTWNVMALR